MISFRAISYSGHASRWCNTTRPVMIETFWDEFAISEWGWRPCRRSRSTTSPSLVCISLCYVAHHLLQSHGSHPARLIDRRKPFHFCGRWIAWGVILFLCNHHPWTRHSLGGEGSCLNCSRHPTVLETLYSCPISTSHRSWGKLGGSFHSWHSRHGMCTARRQ